MSAWACCSEFVSALNHLSFQFQMPGHSWAPQGCKWLEGEAEGYCEAAEQGTLKDFYSDLLRCYFKRFHWSIPDDADADTTPMVNLADYNDNDPDLEVLLQCQAEIYDKKHDVHVFAFFDGMTLC